MENTKVPFVATIQNVENTKVPPITNSKYRKHKSSAILRLTGVTFVFSIYWNHKSLSNLIENVKNTKPDAENNEEPLSRKVCSL